MNDVRVAGLKARRRARELLLRALYQHQLAQTGYEDLHQQFAEQGDWHNADQLYFDGVLKGVLGRLPELEAHIARHATRDPAQLEPVLRAVLWTALYELLHRDDIPHRVVINEAVELSKRYGGTDSHRFVNALLDRVRSGLGDPR